MSQFIEAVYEVVDATDPEIYWPLGMFLTRESAMQAITVDDPDSIRGGGSLDDFRVMEVRERKIGFGEHRNVVGKMTWTSEYDEAKDEYKWTRKEGL
jgi:hypothetical protein